MSKLGLSAPTGSAGTGETKGEPDLSADSGADLSEEQMQASIDLIGPPGSDLALLDNVRGILEVYTSHSCSSSSVVELM
jgi:hypothetical protein